MEEEASSSEALRRLVEEFDGRGGFVSEFKEGPGGYKCLKEKVGLSVALKRWTEELGGKVGLSVGLRWAKGPWIKRWNCQWL